MGVHVVAAAITSPASDDVEVGLTGRPTPHFDERLTVLLHTGAGNPRPLLQPQLQAR